MPTLTTGAIKSLKMPDAFSEHSEQIGGLGGDNWTHSYRIPKERYPEISCRYSGFPLYEDDETAFRNLLKQGDGIVFEQANPQYCNKTNLDLVRQVSPALGNSGSNQIANPDGGPMFNLKKMEVRHINGRPVLHVLGWFQDLQMEPKVYLSCVFIDADAKSEKCRVEELYFQSYPLDIFDKYLPEFEKTLDTIKWTN